MAAASCSRAATAGGRRGLVGLFIGRDGAEGHSRAVAACAPTSTVGRHPVGEARRGEAAVTRRQADGWRREPRCSPVRLRGDKSVD